MWNPFKKNKQNEPSFNKFNKYVNKEKYFARVKKWDWLNENQICIPDKDKEGKVSMNTLDYWLQEIFLDATGDKTIGETFELMKQQYRDSKMPIPKELENILIDNIETLSKELKYIKLDSQPMLLEDEIRFPLSKES